VEDKDHNLHGREEVVLDLTAIRMEVLHNQGRMQLTASSRLDLGSRVVAAGNMARLERLQVTLQTMACWVRLVGVQLVCG